MNQRVPHDWIKVCSTKKTNRYHSPEVLQALDALTLAKEELTVECNKAWDSFLADFSMYYIDFRSTVHAFAALDCLYSLAIVSRNQVMHQVLKSFLLWHFLV
jgi:DNA mismatch repair protein MSH3